MADHTDNAQRTEEPTPKRLDDTRKKGDAPKSQEVIATVLLISGALGLWLLADNLALKIAEIGLGFIDHPHAFLITPDSLQHLFSTVALQLGAGLSGLALLTVLAAILANAGQAKPVFTTHKMKPDFGKLSPIAGFKRIFGPTGLVNFIKGLGKLLLVGAIMVYALWPDRQILVNTLYTEDYSVFAIIKTVVLRLLVLTGLAMTVIAGLDFAWQTYSWKKRLKMTREEVRRELKETEGDPQIKARRRQLREAQARRRTIEAVKDATVLIMNPTHFAVALQYHAEEHQAPICTAQGVDDLALRMRQVARDHQVPVVENPPLARALHAGADLDREIPIDHYEAVAKVIGFIMSRTKP